VDTNKEKPDKVAVYLPEDRELILSLLKEYSEKLMYICKQINDENYSLNDFIKLEKTKEVEQNSKTFFKRQRQLLILTALSAMVSIMMLAIFSTSLVANLTKFIQAIVYVDKVIPVVGIAFSLLLIYYNLIYMIKFRQKEDFLKHSSRTIAFKLKKIIRAASQIDEHIETSFAKRIELDLRIADAESALEYYELVTGVSRKKNL